jgi:outer membrane protein
MKPLSQIVADANALLGLEALEHRRHRVSPLARTTALTVSIMLLALLPQDAAAQEVPAVRIGFVKVERVLAADWNVSRALAQADRAVHALARAYPMELVLQDAVYAAFRMDVTAGVLEYMKNGTVGPSPLPEPMNRLRIAFVNRERAEMELRAPIGPALKDLVQRFGIDLVLDKAVFASVRIDVTQELVTLAKGGKPDAARMAALPGLGPRIAHVWSERLFNEPRVAKAAKERISVEFEPRDREVSDLLLQHGSDSPEFRQALARFQKELNARRNAELDAIVQTANRVIRSLADARNLDFVLQDVLYADARLDITPEVIAELDRQ